MSVKYSSQNFSVLYWCTFQIIKKIEDGGAQFLKTNYSRDATSVISKGFNYVQVEVSNKQPKSTPCTLSKFLVHIWVVIANLHSTYVIKQNHKWWAVSYAAEWNQQLIHDVVQKIQKYSIGGLNLSTSSHHLRNGSFTE